MLLITTNVVEHQCKTPEQSGRKSGIDLGLSMEVAATVEPDLGDEVLGMVCQVKLGDDMACKAHRPPLGRWPAGLNDLLDSCYYKLFRTTLTTLYHTPRYGL